MTSKVAVRAECTPDRHVKVELFDKGVCTTTVFLENGTQDVFYIYEDVTIKVTEEPKIKRILR